MVGLFVLNLVLSLLSITVQVPKVLMLLVSLVILGAGVLPFMPYSNIHTN